jgi:exopolyphosphatase / guanosine-5'-triphosphate,3'-diphosphate pyrophosphatase
VKPFRRALIDVGTNSVKLLVAEIDGPRIRPLLEKSEQTRLGQGFYETHRLQPATIDHTARAVRQFVDEAERSGVSGLRLIATSAARDALNQNELQEAVRRRSGLNLEIISGEQEAEWVYQGVKTDPGLAGKRLLILDVGGGSTEFIVGNHEHHSFRQSFAMGSVRLMEKLRPADPPSPDDLTGCRTWLADYFNREIGPRLEGLLQDPIQRNLQLVGTGGTTTILARMQRQMADFDRERIDGTRLSREQVLEFMVHLWSQPLAQRQNIIGLPPDRADIILMGVAIYEAVMAHFQFENIYVSTRGLRFGALLDPK